MKTCITPSWRYLMNGLMVALGLVACAQITIAQDLILSTYSGQSEIKTYKGGSITLKNGFNTAGHNVHIFISSEIQPVPVVPPALSSDQNYIATWTAKLPIKDANLLPARPLKDAQLSVQYFDGLGRLVQTVLKQGSLATATGGSGDLVTVATYDQYGRDSSKLLPYFATGTANGSFKDGAPAAQQAWYNGNNSPVNGQGENGTNARSLTLYEPSPLNRVAEAYAPGNNWIGTVTQALESNRHSTKQKYFVNTAVDAVESFDIDINANFGTFKTPVPKGIYVAGQLYKDITVNEVGKQVVVFKDKDEHVILKKVQLTASADNGSGSGHTGWLCTYYIYDDLENLRCIIQPKGVEALSTSSWVMTSSILDEQCFRYEYDGKNRMIIKKVPGAGPVYLVYNLHNQVVLTQDSMMRKQKQWIATRYDDQDRPDTTWLYNSGSATFAQILVAADGSDIYPATAPATAAILTETHYDDYEKLPSGLASSFIHTWDVYFLPPSSTSFPYAETPSQNSFISTKGMVTWTSAKVLDSTPALILPSVNIYDDKGRVIQTQAKNITGGIDVTSTQYSWAGWPLLVVQKQEEKKGAALQTTIVVTKMTYDDLGRVVKTERRLGNSKVDSGRVSAYAAVSEIQYDTLGHVRKKLLGKRRNSTGVYTSTPLEAQVFDYNIRGWLLGINRAYVGDDNSTSNTNTASAMATVSGEMFTESAQDIQSISFPTTSYFGFDLGYDKVHSQSVSSVTYDTARFDGNIAGITWKGVNDKKLRKYDFSYDASSRLTTAKFGQYVNNSFGNALVNYNVNNLKYDANGNILSMNQYGLKTNGESDVIDHLTYTYLTNSNKLAKVEDTAHTESEHLGDFQDGSNIGNDYTYDGNGNMTKDNNKNITSIAYNILNLPSIISVTGGSIKYYYDANGNKLQKRTIQNISPSRNTNITYIGNAVYRNDTLQFFGMDESRIRSNSGKTGWIYDYFLKDHQGNTRMMITDDYKVSSAVLEASSYYPFGLQQHEISLVTPSELHNFKNTFQNQEINEDLGIGVYEFKYRMDDPQIGRFWQVDPLSDKYEYNSTYAFSADKVTKHIELEGLESYADFRVEQDLRDVESGKITTEQLDKRLNVRAKSDALAVGLGLIIAGAVEELGAGSVGKAIRSLVSRAKGESKNEPAAEVETSPATSSGKTQRSVNKLGPDKDNASGDHSTFLRDDNNDIYKYQEWKKNDRNPNKFDAGKRFDGGQKNGKPGNPHTDKKTKVETPTPHLNEGRGRARKPGTYEFPNNKRFQQWR